MALKLIDTIKRYSGLSTDTKPTVDVPVGSIFFETDDGPSFFYDGTNWDLTFPSIDVDSHGAQVVTGHIEHEVHVGHMFTATFAETLGSGSASVVMFVTPGTATVAVHFDAVLDSSAAGTIYLDEAPNTTVGTVVIAHNNNRKVGGSSNTAVYSNGAITSVGTVLEYGVVGSGASKKIGGQLAGENERDLKFNTRYSVSFTASAATNVAWNLFFVEEPT